MKNLYLIIIALAFFSDATAQSIPDQSSNDNSSRSNDFINQSGSNEIRLKDYKILWVFNDVGNHNTNRNGNSDNTTYGIESSDYLKVATSLFPLPAKDHLNFTFSTDINSGMILIYDANGKTILTQKISGNEAMISSSDFIPGIYYYQILSENKIVNSGKFLKN